MKTISIILPILVLTFIILTLYFLTTSRAEETKGLVDGLLSKCPNKPNCICSEHKDDADHYIAPIPVPQNRGLDIISILKSTIHDMGGNIRVEGDHYLAATFTSNIFKFVDDLEIRVDQNQKLIHIRSASRVGYSDMGVNRKRVESFKTIFDNKVSAAAHTSSL